MRTSKLLRALLIWAVYAFIILVLFIIWVAALVLVILPVIAYALVVVPICWACKCKGNYYKPIDWVADSLFDGIVEWGEDAIDWVVGKFDRG